MLLLDCSKSDGIILCKAGGSNRRLVASIVPARAVVRKISPGDLSFVANRHRGEWEVRVLNESGSGLDFHMRSKGDALSLKKWVDKYAAKRGGE